jgi:hypothetical protein
MAMTFLKKLRDAAMQCSNVDYRALLRAEANLVQASIDMFAVMMDDDSLRHLNGAWASAHRVLKNMPPEGDPAPLGGSTEATKFVLPAKRHEQRHEA